jgi:ribonuclease HII
MIAGVDEAGRGCVLGPLVICAYATEPENEIKFRKMGVRDSKMLTAEQREKLAAELEQYGKYSLAEIPADEITRAMKSKVSLNELEAKKASEALVELEKKLAGSGKEIDAVFVDSPDPVPKKFEGRIRKYFHTKARVVCANYADKRFPCVSAASIIAKVTRDAELEKIKKILGHDFGSGYTHDPLTIEFVKKHHRDPKLVPYLRMEWITIRRLRMPQQLKLGEFSQC